MTMDLSPLIESAHRDSTSWNTQSVRNILDKLTSSLSSSQSDWEEGDEEWGRVVVGNEVVAFVCAKLPIVVVHSMLSDIASTWGENHDGAAVIVKDNFDADDFMVDRSLLERIFNREISSHIDCDALSINDLWWATV